MEERKLIRKKERDQEQGQGQHFSADLCIYFIRS